MARLLAAAVALLIAACGSGGSSSTAGTPSPPAATAQVSMLFMGNSHTSVNDVPGLTLRMVRAAWPDKTAEAVTAPEWMSLQDRSRDAASLALLRSRAWKFVVLQAQDYSSSGLYSYPIDGAVALVGESRKAGALPILFPEWPRRGINETQRIYDLHLSIAREAPACVPPIPQAFDLAIARNPDLVLWAEDGNHSAPAGAFLAALVIATTMTGVAPDTLPTFADVNVDAATQGKLRSAAAETVLAYSPRTGCPGDAPSR